MPSTRSASSSAGSLDFPSTKSSSSLKKSSGPASKAITPKTGFEASLALFRSEAIALLSAPPPVPPHIKLASSDKVIVNAAIERISSRGVQQSLSFCHVNKKGKEGEFGESWVTKMEGERVYFPRIGQVKKRLRALEESDEEREQEDDALVTEETPRKSGRKSSSSSSKKRSSAPHAPRKSRRTGHSSSSRHHHDADHSDDDLNEGSTTATEATSHLASRHGRARDAAPLASSSASSSRRTTRTSRASTAELFAQVKQEELEAGDAGYLSTATVTSDLASLCGRVQGLGVRGTAEPESGHDNDFPSFPSSTAYDFPALSESSISDAAGPAGGTRAASAKGKGRAI
ncbi:hypothetical protein JCM11251_004072 [Rhodosporidiobolus azoricus]